jgi:uncharacterized protein (TIGR03437 family)
VTASGWNLASQSQGAVAGVWPSSLGGTRVMVTDSAGVSRLAPLLYVSPGQVNFQMPARMAAGLAAVGVIAGESASSGTYQVAAVSPGVFTANQDGNGVAAAIAVRESGAVQSAAPVFRCGAVPGSCTPVPIDLGGPADQVVLELFGTGIRGRSSLSNVTCTIGGTVVPVLYAGAQGQFQGLDQVNVALPRSLAGAGQAVVKLVVDGQTANDVAIAVQ